MIVSCGSGAELIRTCVPLVLTRSRSARCASSASTSGHPGLTVSDLSGGHGHSVHDCADAIVAYALSAPGGPTGTFANRDGEVAW
jgi:hypothetical protein